MRKLLRKFPRIYQQLKEIYYGLRGYLERGFMGTIVQELIWKKKKTQSSDGYFGAINHSHRSFLVESIEKKYPYLRVLEIGCNIGSNLLLLARKHPEVSFYGLDINKEAIDKGREILSKEGVNNIYLSVGRLDTIFKHENNSFDIVISDAVLLYVVPKRIKKVIKEMVRITNKAIIINEWNKNDLSLQMSTYYYGHWIHDYISLFSNYVPLENIERIKINSNIWNDKKWIAFGEIITINK